MAQLGVIVKDDFLKIGVLGKRYGGSLTEMAGRPEDLRLIEPRLTAGGRTGSDQRNLSNAMVALHRRHFGRGPGAAKGVIADGLAICVLTDIFTRAERHLIEVEREEHVQLTRMLHRVSCEEEYKEAAADALDRPVIAHTGSVHIGPDMAVEVFVLAPAPGNLGGGADGEG